jgi:uncharacterized protein YndB with AHSA1/START domain
MTTPDVPHRFELTVEVPGTPEQVWHAIATANGISSWMLPTSMEERVGGEVRFHMGETDSVGSITAYDAPHRIAYEEPDWAGLAGHAGADVTPLATEFLVEAKAGGTCVVRVVSSAFGTGAEWEDDFWEGMVDGWTPAFEILRLVLRDFPGQTVSSLDAMVEVDREQPDVLAAMRSSVFDQGVQGEWVQDTPSSATLRMAAPVPGFLVLMAIPAGEGKTAAGIQGHLFSPDAQAWIDSTKKEWQVWLEGLAG